MFLRLCLTIALVTQSLMPLSMAMASEGAYGLSAFTCNPADTAPSAKAKAQLTTLMTALENAVNDNSDVNDSDHCANCILGFSGLINDHIAYAVPAEFSPKRAFYFTTTQDGLCTARGPPLGGRAPPGIL